ncbi:hypothetical protein D3C81_1817240 [compost metagenome]
MMVIGGHGSVPVQLNDTAQAAARASVARVGGLVGGVPTNILTRSGDGLLVLFGDPGWCHRSLLGIGEYFGLWPIAQCLAVGQ